SYMRLRDRPPVAERARIGHPAGREPEGRMKESRREALAHNLFEVPASEGAGAIVAGLLYDMVSLPYRLLKNRRRKRLRLEREARQEQKRAARLARRARK